MELLVAITITMFMLLLINQVFFRTTQGISQGIAVAEKVAGSRSVSEQIERDFATMMGPLGNDSHVVADNSSGGVLIIVNQMRYFDQGDNFWGVELAKPYGPDQPEYQYLELPPAGVNRVRRGNVVYRPVRIDQLVFIRSIDAGELPITPAGSDTFTSWDDGGLAKYQLVRYQHGKRTNEDGSSDLTEFLGNPGADLRATDWILTRQALFLGENDANPGMFPDHPSYGAASPAWNAAVEPLYPLYMGTTDYAVFSLSDFNHPNGCLVGSDADAATGNGTSLRLHSGLTADQYHALAVTSYTYLATRLRVNPTPTGWDSRSIAQQHPFLMEHVSDFIVEFAADIYTLDGDATIAPDGVVDYDVDASGTTDDFNGDGNPDAFTYVGGNIRWYGYWYNDPKNNQRRVVLGNGAIGTGGFDPKRPVVYQPHTDWGPYQDQNGPNPGTFVFRHDDKNSRGGDDNAPPDKISGYDGYTLGPNQTSNWPYLLRIRYRVHDKDGVLKSGDNQHGLWFEQIVKVPRP